MGSKFSSGFTIIEVMLFLAITGLMLAGILANANRSVNEQHYRDGVESVRNVFASEYAKVYSLTNSATSAVANPCVDDGAAPAKARGMSDCLYVGRLIEIAPTSGDGSSLKVRPVVARALTEGNRYGDSSVTTGAAIANAQLTEEYSFRVADGLESTANSSLVTNDTLPWSLAAVRPGADGSEDRMNVSFLILRSPIDGSVQSYNLRSSGAGDDDRSLGDEPDLENLGNYLNANYLNPIRLCVADLGGGYDPAQRMGIFVHRSATSASDIETKSEGSGC